MTLSTHDTDELAEWVYGKTLYPNTYRKIVADTRAKKDQYRDIVAHLPKPNNGIVISILEPGPSNVPLLKNAIYQSGLRLANYQLTGLDKFPRMHPEGMEMLTGSVTAIPLPDNSVDCVVMSSVLIFIGNQQMALDECSRVLKPGGNLILSEPDAEHGLSLTKAVFQYEIVSISTETSAITPVWKRKWTYFWRVFKSVALRIPYLIPTIFINRRVVKSQSANIGFLEQELAELINYSGLHLNNISRTYANAYFLMVATKPAWR